MGVIRWTIHTSVNLKLRLLMHKRSTLHSRIPSQNNFYRVRAYSGFRDETRSYFFLYSIQQKSSRLMADDETGGTNASFHM
jgi:hypothetical protein